MPSDTEKQARFMAACHHGAGYASCPPAKVSAEFNEADKGTPMLHNAMLHRLRNRVHRAFGGPMPAQGTALVRPPVQPQMGIPGQAGAMQMNPAVAAAMSQAQAQQPRPMQAGPTMQQRPAAPMPAPQATMPSRMQPGQPAGPQNQQAIQQALLAARNNANNTLGRPIGPPMGGRPMMRQMAGGGLAAPGLGSTNFQTPVSPLSTLMGHGMAARHAGFSGPRKPRIPLPGSLRNINQSMGRLKNRLG